MYKVLQKNIRASFRELGKARGYIQNAQDIEYWFLSGWIDFAEKVQLEKLNKKKSLRRL